MMIIDDSKDKQMIESFKQYIVLNPKKQKKRKYNEVFKILKRKNLEIERKRNNLNRNLYPDCP